nr:ATP-binding cassette domain-containing protein [Actinomycetota bacterium]
MVRLSGVSKSFGAVEAVRDLNLELTRGNILALLGPSGCGKTTTLRLLAGFESPGAGEIEIAGH